MTEQPRASELSSQVYFELGPIPHMRQDGTPTSLICWASHCAECGKPFAFFTPAHATPALP
jgi:hypothetical protein